MGGEGVSLIILLCSTFLTRPARALTLGSSVHCAVRREISPCTCRMQEPSGRSTKSISVTCEGMDNFQQVITALQDKFDKTVDISLKITHSTLDDLPQLSFQQLGLTIHLLWLNHDNLSALPESVFSGLGRTELFSLADNSLDYVPQQVLKLMPKIKTLDLSRGRIVNISSSDFQELTTMHALLIKDNRISNLEENSFPPSLIKLQLANNSLPTLNKTVRGLYYLEWLWLAFNKLESLDGELPQTSPNTKLNLIDASHNRLVRVPQELRHFLALENLFLSHNLIRSLDGAVSTAKKLKQLYLTHNNISVLWANDFSELTELDTLMLGENQITSLNGSLLPLKTLDLLNLTHNSLKEFNLQEIRGLTRLTYVDLSYNKISKLVGKMENMVELETRVEELRLDNNELTSLSRALCGLAGLQKLNISHNLLEHLAPEDLEGLDELHTLDISHNHLTSFDGTSKTVLVSLEELIASHNWLVTLDTDFYGLPRLCWAHLQYNRITFVSSGVADRTQCQLYGVNSTLRIYLQGNPGACSSDVMSNIQKLESRNNTKVHGLSPTDCPVTTPAPPAPTIPTVTTSLPTTTTTTTTTTTSAPPTTQPTLAPSTTQLTTASSMTQPTTAISTTQPTAALPETHYESPSTTQYPISIDEGLNLTHITPDNNVKLSVFDVKGRQIV